MSQQEDNIIISPTSPTQDICNAGHSYQSQLEALKKLPVPYSDLYQALTSHDEPTTKSLEANIRKAASSLTVWIETAKLAVLGLEIKAKENKSSEQDLKDIELIMNRFYPNIEMTMELCSKIEAKLESSDGASDQPLTDDIVLTKEELQSTSRTIRSSWNLLKAMLDEVKGIFAGAQARQDILTRMEDVLAEIEGVGLEIDRFQEERKRQTPDILETTTASFGSSSFSLSTASLDETQSKHKNMEGLSNVDSRIENLTHTVKDLTTQVEELTLTDFKGHELQDQYRDMLKLWDDTKGRREKIGEELKEERWLGVFEQVAKQIESMMESLDRAIVHCKGLVDQIITMVKEKEIPAAPIDREHLYTIFKSFETKHKYYEPAVNKMLNMLENGIESRSTNNKDVIQKHKVMKTKWEQLRSRLDRVELDLDGIEEMLDILDASIPSHIPTPPAQLPEKPLFSMRRSQIQPEWKAPGPLTLFQPPQQDPQQQRGRRPLPKSTSAQSPKDSPTKTSPRSPLNANNRSRPWSPAPSINSITSMLSPNMSSNFRSLSRNSSRSPSRPNSEKPRPWCPSTTKTSPSIPGIPHAPSARATYTPRSKSTTRVERAASPVPAMPSGTGSTASKTRSTSCTPSMDRTPSQPRPVFSPVGSMSKLYSGANPPRSTSPAPVSGSGRRSQSKAPPPVVTNVHTRSRQHSAPGTPISQTRRSSSPIPPKSTQSSQRREFSPPVVSRQRQPNNQNRSVSQAGHRQDDGGAGRNRRLSFGNCPTSHPSESTTKDSTDNSCTLYGLDSSAALSSASGMGADSSVSLPIEEPTSPSTSSSSSLNSFNRIQGQQFSLSADSLNLLSNPKTEIESVSYIPSRGDELDEGFARIVNKVQIKMSVRRLGEGKYYLGGRVEERAHGKLVAVGGKSVLCRLMEYGRQGGSAEDDSGISSGGSHSGVEDAVIQQQQKQQSTSQRVLPDASGISLRRPEPAAGRSTRPRASSYTNTLPSKVNRNKKVMVRVGGGWQDLEAFLLELVSRFSNTSQ
ncbi:hypothetical protein BGZ76_009518 [Entomortierella beljakovae]|nr:hypothetical protein BGZ76_009518 [Entomortierella beljakovae]